MVKYLNILYWIFFISTIITFWVSIRSETNQMEFTLLGISMWGVAFGLHWLIKRIKDAN